MGKKEKERKRDKGWQGLVMRKRIFIYCVSIRYLSLNVHRTRARTCRKYRLKVAAGPLLRNFVKIMQSIIAFTS